MKIGDLVTGKSFFSTYGIGIVVAITAKGYGGIKVYWPTQGCWCYTSEIEVRLVWK